MTTLAEAGLRRALRRMLDDQSYPRKLKAQPWIEARLAQPESAWNAAIRRGLIYRACEWGRLRNQTVLEALTRLLGEEMPVPYRRPHTPTPHAEDQLHGASILEGSDAMQTTSIDSMMTTGKEYDDAMDALYGRDAETITRLRTQVERLRTAYHFPESRGESAVKAVAEGRVWAAPDADDVWSVASSKKGDVVYQVDRVGCSCMANATSRRTRWACYHTLAVELYRVQPPQAQGGLFATPAPVEEALAEPPVDPVTGEVIQDTPENAPSSPAEAFSPRPSTFDTPETFVGNAESVEETSMATTTVPPETTVPLPTPAAMPNGHRLSAALPLALPLRSIHAIVADFAKTLPPECIAHKEQGGRQIDFVPWYVVAEVLDAYAPGWRGEVRSIQEVTTVVGSKREGLRSVKGWGLTYRLTIPCAEGEAYREAVGLEHEDEPIYGDTMTNAQATAFKRAAAMFGIAADLYDKQEKAEHFTGALRKEKAELLQLLRPELERRGLDPQEVLNWLKRQTGAIKNADVSVAALKALFAHLGIVTDEGEAA